MKWRWKRRAQEPDEFLTTAADGEPQEFGETGREFFAAAWNTPDDLSGIEDFAAQTDSERADEADVARQLSRRPRAPIVVLGLVVVAGGIAAWGVQAGWFSSPDEVLDDGVVFESVIVSPQDPRSYDGDRLGLQPSLDEAVDRGVASRDQLSSQLVADDAIPSLLPRGVRFTTLLWGGRLQVLVTGPTDMIEDACLIVSLVAADLRALDVASSGAGCEDIHQVTGDRRSCEAPGVTMLELWPPIARTDLLEPPEAVERIRVRVERTDIEPWQRVSVRGELDLRATELADLPRLGEEPGATLDARVGVNGAECVLLDRSGVEIRVL